MTKRTVVGILCILLAVLLGAGGEGYLRGTARGLLNAAEVPETASAEAVFAAAERTVSLWDGRQALLGVILKHSDADALDKLFLRLRYALDARDAGLCTEALLACRTEVAVLLEGERFSWENVLHINGKNFLKSFTFINI